MTTRRNTAVPFWTSLVVISLLLMSCRSSMPSPVPLQATIIGLGTVSTRDADEYAPYLSASGDSLLFTRRVRGSAPAIYLSLRQRDGRWSAPSRLSISDPDGAEYPSLSADGRRLLFATRRPHPGGQSPLSRNDIWSTTRLPNGEWSAPTPLPPPVNTEGVDSYPRETASGALFFHSGRPGGVGSIDIYRATPSGAGYATPELLPFNSPAVDGEAAISGDENIIVFMSQRPLGRGGCDLYITRRHAGEWSTPVNMGALVNTGTCSSTPFLTADGRRLLFARTDDLEQSDIYEVSMAPPLSG